MKYYLFISNSTKPTYEQQISRDRVQLSNVSLPCIEAALSMGYEVYLGVNRLEPEELECDYDIKFYNSSTYRSLFDIKSNYIAYKHLMSILTKDDIDVIHCNTPIGGIMGRLCGNRARVRKIIYTAHGFHFYKGAPFINRTLFKWAEMLMARYTDVIITINNEDFQAAKKFKLRNDGRVYYVPGVGVDTNTYYLPTINKLKYRQSLGLLEDDICLIAMGDLIPRKNYATSIKAIAQANNSKIHFLIAGEGPELNKLQNLARELGINKQVHFLGFRKDIKQLLNIADIFLFTTYQEGLPRSMMEAMAAGLPCIVSNIRGNVDLMEENKGGYIRNPEDTEGFAEAIVTLATNKELRKSMGLINLDTIKRFDIEVIKEDIKKIYEEQLL